MELKFVLDFDGVLFNSAFEAYSVCQATVADEADCRQDVDFEEFLEFRGFVTDAWQYRRLFHPGSRLAQIADLPLVEPVEADWAFAERFFATRARIMRDRDWPKIMSPYDFFFLLKPLLLDQPERFAILSTRNVESIRQTMAFYDADVIEIFGQEDIRRLGSKIEVANHQGWLEKGRYLVAYVDDMNSHLEPFDGKVHLPLHADWGYDKTEASSLSQHQVLTIIQSMLKIARPQDSGPNDAAQI
ncbi:MAG TPA: hypothetical protein VF592_08620 [Sphingomonas sp.]|uniref:hypothetical protein n=1 Tax=Sphingomonas sp. TaxID=28214 RepID=UPI002EDB4554